MPFELSFHKEQYTFKQNEKPETRDCSSFKVFYVKLGLQIGLFFKPIK
jgi:hypothetical protein